MRTKLCQLALAFSIATFAAAQEPTFATGTLAEARARAKEQKRGLIVDFSHDTIAPCRRMRDETWRTATLWQELSPAADVIRIDPESDPAAAAEFVLTAYPTIVVIGRDGAECHRRLGFHSAAELRYVLVEAIDPPPTKWRARDKLAAALAKKGDLDGAGRHYLWLWDEGVAHDRTFEFEREADFLQKLIRFAKRHPPTMAALQQRREAMLVAAGQDNPDYEDLSALVVLTEALADVDGLLALRTAVPQGTWDNYSYVFEQLTDAVLPKLVAKERFAEAAPFLGDPVARFTEGLRHISDAGLGFGDVVRRRLVWDKVREHKPTLTILFALKDERAQALADSMLEKDGGVRTWILIMEAAKAAGAEVVSHDWATKALLTLPEKDHERVRAFLQRR